ncbi:MAG: efflux RND transporter periplasmic adaptor subunit [Acidobacteriota bacterium]|nr:efflux RND transporter periplasmic adaptor subunit [Acidobacteriota bacterium]
MRRMDATGILVLLSLLMLVFGGGWACGGNQKAQTDSDSVSQKDDEKDTQQTADDSDDAKKDGKKEEDEEEAVPVELVTLERGPIETVLRFSTNLEAESDVKVFSQAARKVRSLLVEEGDEVRKGQVLLRLEDDEQRTALARVESQLAKATREYTRQTDLYEKLLISEQTFNEATYEIEQLELALKDAQRNLGYTAVRAPISGTVTARLVNIGDQVTPNQHLFDLVDFDSIVARVYVPEKELARLRPGVEARIIAEAAGGEARRGTVDRMAPRVDPKSGTVKATVTVPRSEGLLPGMYVSVELVTDVHTDAVLVPKKALIYDGDQIYVFRVKEEERDDLKEGEWRVERLLIEAALEDRHNIEPAGVLEAADRIVVAGQAGLKEGSLVREAGKKIEDAEDETEAD